MRKSKKLAAPTRLRNGRLDPAEWIALPTPSHCGAVAFFAGTVRDIHEERAVTAIRYHAYAPLAEARLKEIEEEAGKRFNSIVAVAHATGMLRVGDASVVVIAWSGHRKDAFAACRWAIDTIKTSVPIWKEEHFADGEVHFQEGTPLQDVNQP
jgi:molybdopterin synthase catalytic subunit